MDVVVLIKVTPVVSETMVGVEEVSVDLMNLLEGDSKHLQLLEVKTGKLPLLSCGMRSLLKQHYIYSLILS